MYCVVSYVSFYQNILVISTNAAVVYEVFLCGLVLVFWLFYIGLCECNVLFSYILFVLVA